MISIDRIRQGTLLILTSKEVRDDVGGGNVNLVVGNRYRVTCLEVGSRLCLTLAEDQSVEVKTSKVISIEDLSGESLRVNTAHFTIEMRR